MGENKKYFGPITNNRLLVLLYRKIFGKDLPSWFRKNSIFIIIIKPLRKFLNVVIIPNIPFNTIRIWLYRMIGYSIGKNVFIGMKCYLDDVKPNFMTIEDNVTISYSCIFATHGRAGNSWANKPILIKQGSYIGAGSIILPGVVIGKDVTVAAGSVVTKNFKDSLTIAGVPAKIIKIE